MILGAMFYFDFNRNITRGASLLPKKIIKIENQSSETLSFLATYIIPLACLDMDKDRSLPMLILILILIGWIYIKTNLFYTNPTLSILGFHVYKIDTEKTPEIIVVTKSNLDINNNILIRKIDQNLYFAKLD
jgi:hypothetical protein